MSEVTNQAWFCSRCGRKNEPGGLFCGGCGNRAPRWAMAPAEPVTEPEAVCWVCPQCGRENSPGGEFCPGCGTGRHGAAAPVTAAVPEAVSGEVPAVSPEAVPETAPEIPEEAPKKKKKKGLAAGLIALILVILLAGGAVWYFVLRDEPAPSADEEVETGDEQDEEDEEEDRDSDGADAGTAAGDDTAAPESPDGEEELRNGTYVEQDEDGVSTYYYEDDILVLREKEYDDGTLKINTFQYYDDGARSAITWENYGADGVLITSGIEYLSEGGASIGYDSISYYPDGQINFEYKERRDEQGSLLCTEQVGYTADGTLRLETMEDRTLDPPSGYQINYEGDWTHSKHYELDENGVIRWQESESRQQTGEGGWSWQQMEFDEYGNWLYLENKNDSGYTCINTYEYLDPSRGMLSREYSETGDGFWTEAVYVYDENGLTVERVESTGGNGTAGGSTTTYSYNELDQCIYMQEVHLDGRTEDTYLSYDQWGNVSLEEWSNSRGDYQIEQYSYDEEGRQLYARMENGNGYGWEQRHEYFETGGLKLYEFHQVSGEHFEEYQYCEYREDGLIVVERGWTKENGVITEEYENVY